MTMPNTQETYMSRTRDSRKMFQNAQQVLTKDLSNQQNSDSRSKPPLSQI